MQREPDMGADEPKDWKASKEGPGVKLILAIGAALGLGIFALQNMDGVDVDLLFWDANVALWVVIAGCAALGFAAGWLLGRASGRRRAI